MLHTEEINNVCMVQSINKAVEEQIVGDAYRKNGRDDKLIQKCYSEILKGR
jgi:hypothetical protein